nr:tripartite motif-containing protein 45-like [Crassostrea gigas]
MAAGKEKQVSLETGVTTACPICFESFKTPRILPCLHTFCHNCLSPYILSTCKSKESPVGFPCPLCRSFVPAPSFSVELEKWSELIPINKAIQVLIEKGDRLCDACQREDEEIVASDWCESCSDTLCAVCAKAHKRNAASRNHTLVPIADFSKMSCGKESMESTPVVCKDHNKLMEYFCVDHEELSCTKCVCTKHRTCTQVDDIEEAADSLRKSEKIKTLSEEISQFEGSLVKAKSNGEDTIRYIDDTSDQIKKESTELRDKIMNHVNALLEDHLSELAHTAKEHRGNVASVVDAVSDRQLLVAQYLHSLEDTEKLPASVLVNEYLKIKKQFAYVTKSELEKWSEHIPVKKTFQVLIEKGDKLCDACQREDEDLMASDWCESCSDSLCAVCAKAHKRNTASRNHTLVPIADFCKVPGGNESFQSAPVVCQEHRKRVKYICVDHEELCCTKCVCTKHRKCTQVDDIEEAAENLRKSEKIKKLSKEISQFEGSFTKAKSNGEDNIRYIDNTSDKIKEESIDLKDKIVNHVNALLENHLSELAQNAKKQKERLASFVDAASDRQFLMAQYLHTLEFSEDTPAPVLVQDYYTIKRQGQP